MKRIIEDMRNNVLCRVYTGEKVENVTKWLDAYPAVYIVADRNVSEYAERIAGAMSGSGKCFGTYFIEATEAAKDLETIVSICRWLLEKKADRKALLLAVGGGITTDMAGFAASIYKRGIRFAYVPTTFLAQVDAAVGGKTGVNLDNLKNILGVIRQPDFTYECPEVLCTLPYRDFISGAAELVKTFIIDNTGEYYEKSISALKAIRLAQSHEKSISENLPTLEDLIGRAAEIKAGVVDRDQFENGERRKLNLGHTFAHAIEWKARENEDDITHGEAVAMGIILAANMSEKFYGTRGLADKLREDFQSAGLPVDCPYPLEALISAMCYDKKAEGGKIHFVLMAGVGDVRIEECAPEEASDMIIH